jgi:hypothetical protein
MSDRITTKNVDARAEAVNRNLRDELHIVPNGRNGYTALDLCDAHGVVRMLTAGTKREVYDYMSAMIETLTIVGRGHEVDA